MKVSACHALWGAILFAWLAPTSCPAQLPGAPESASAPIPAATEEPYEHSPEIMKGLMKQWREPMDAAARRELYERIYREAPHLEQRNGDLGYSRQALLEIVAGGPAAEKEIKPRLPATTIKLNPIKVFSEIADPAAEGGAAWQARRITKDAFEVWCSKEGWLFDGTGKLLHHAVVPRRDGTGLEWFGAFLLDGQWVTTDLWSYDRALYMYSKDGKFLKDLPATYEESGGAGTERGLFGWACSDREGKGWVYEIVGNYSGARFWIGPDWKPRELKEPEGSQGMSIEPWSLCYPRQLGVRYNSVPSDDGTLMLGGYEAGHGSYVGLPTYALYKRGGEAPDLPAFRASELANPKILFSVCIPGHARNLGFWPGSDATYIDDGETWNDRPAQTWFFDGSGKCPGWITGKRLADDAAGSGMLFKLPGDNSVLDLGTDMHPREMRKYVSQDARPVNPQTIFDDLKIGLFLDQGKLVLASWQ